MSRTRWTRAELSGYKLVWLVTVFYAGQIIRVATHEVDVETDAGTTHYVGTCEPMRYQRSVDLFSQSAEEPMIAVECRFPIDVPTWATEGHRLNGSRAEVAQVRARVTGLGVTVVDTWEDRRVLLNGVIRDGAYGAYFNGSSEVAFNLVTRRRVSRAKVPATWERVTADTWPTTYLRGEDLGVAYPVLFGYPGRDDKHQDGFIPAFEAVWLRKQLEFQMLCVGLGALGATTVRLARKDDTVGVDVDTSSQYRDYDNSSNVDAFDLLDQRVTVVDWFIGDYGNGDPNELLQGYQPVVADPEDGYTYCALTAAGGGGMLVNGEVCRGAGDVLTYLLGRADVPTDPGNAALLNRFKIDAVIADCVDPLAWIQENLLPLIPASLVEGPTGVRVVAWEPYRTLADCVGIIDADADPTLQPVEKMQEDDAGANFFTINYGWNALAERYRYVVRVGPEAKESNDRARGVIRSQQNGTGSYGQVAITWLESGSAGVGVPVTVTDTGVEGVTSASATGIVITIKGGTTTTTSLVATLNGNASFAALAVATSLDGDLTITWASTSTASVSLQIRDLGTIEHEACRRGRDQRRREEGGTGIVEEEISTDLLYDHASVLAVADWKAAAYAEVPRRWLVNGPEASDLADYDLGDPIAVNDSKLGLSIAVGTVEGIEEDSTGSVTLQVVFVA